MKTFQVAKWGIVEDYGKDFYLSLFLTEQYSFLQVSFSVGEYGDWLEWPYLQISMGYGKLFSFLLCVGKLGFTFDICGRNWKDPFYYTQDYKND